MNDKERSKMQVAEQCAETREEDLGYQMVRHYNYLSSLNHEWRNLCELAVKMYLPNKKYIDKLEQQLKEAESVIEFYGDVENWYTIETKKDDHTALFCDYNNGHKHARQYLVKYKTNE